MTLLERKDNGEIIEISGKSKEVITILQEDLNKSGHPEYFSEGMQKLVSFLKSIPVDTLYYINEILDKAPLILIKENEYKFYISYIANYSNEDAVYATFIQYFEKYSHAMIEFKLKITDNFLTTIFEES